MTSASFSGRANMRGCGPCMCHGVCATVGFGEDAAGLVAVAAVG
jgi:hypothetical protein